jgi:hypothetical protein
MRKMGLFLGTVLVAGALVAAGAGVRVSLDMAGSIPSLGPREARSNPVNPRVPAWTEAVRNVDAAVMAGDVRRATREWQTAYATAMVTRQWQPLVAVGEAARRVATVDHPYTVHAREAFLVALASAVRAGSSEGVLEVAVGFERLGDQEAATALRRIADRMVASASPRLEAGTGGAPSRTYDAQYVP